jgi:hypothetical protein
VTAVDWIIVVFTLLMAVWGYAQGLIVGALSLTGFAVGGLVGSRLGPLLLSEGSRSPYAPVFALGGAFLIGGVLAAGGEAVGMRVRGGLAGKVGILDGICGAALIACVGLLIAWIGGAVALQTPGARELRGDIQRSTILRALNETLPPSGALLNALARFDPFPDVTGPDPEVGPPSARIARDPDVRAATGSVVKVLGTACGLGVQGSGWIAGNGVVVTNAHVVAGQDDTTVQVAGEGPRHDADAIWFDTRNDLAILRASGVAGVRPLRQDVTARVGASAAVVGFPGNEDLTVRPGRLGRTETVISQDAYGNGRIRRRITSVRARVRSGNSGGPAIDGAGRVVTTIFASETNESSTGFGIPASVVADALRRAGDPVDTGPCAS